MRALTISRRYDVEGTVDLSALFALVPDEVVLAVAGRDLELFEYNRCLVGWTLREHLAALSGNDADAVEIGYSVAERTAELLGGDPQDWRAVFVQVQFSQDVPIIEAAWTNRVLQAAENADKPKIALPADIYDTLELSAYAFGGIGAGQYNEGEDDVTDYVGLNGELLNISSEFGDFDVEIDGVVPRLVAPICAVGHAAFAAIPKRFDWYTMISGNTIKVNDSAVCDINSRKGLAENKLDTKVTFEEWARELNVVRGAE